MTGAVSVAPYPSKIRIPNFSNHSSRTLSESWLRDDVAETVKIVRMGMRGVMVQKGTGAEKDRTRTVIRDLRDNR